MKEREGSKRARRVEEGIWKREREEEKEKIRKGEKRKRLEE